MAKQLSVNYSLNTGSKWVYCNYPEKPTVIALGDSSYDSCCVNRQTVDGTGQIFYSSNANDLIADCNFCIRVYNPGSSIVTVTRAMRSVLIGFEYPTKDTPHFLLSKLG